MKRVFTLTGLFLMISLVGFGKMRKPENLNFSNFRTLVQHVQSINRANLLKSTAINKQRLDSVVTGSGGKNIYLYDANGRVLEEATYVLDGASWVGSEKTTYSYNSKGLVSESIWFMGGGGQNNWTMQNKNSFEYNSDNLISSIIAFMLDEESSELVKYARSRAHYDDNKNMVKAEIDGWDGNSNTWIEAVYGSVTYSFDADGNFIEEIGTIYGMKYKIEYSYDDDGRYVKETDSDWDDDNSKWVFTNKIENVYSADGNGWDEVNSEWDESSSDWVKTDKTAYIFDDDGNLVQQVSSNWNTSSSDWDNATKHEYLCNNNYALSDLILPSSCEICGNQIHMVTEVKYYSWDYSTTKWDYGGSAIAHYSAQDVTGIDQINKERVRLFPNPATDYVNVQFSGNEDAVQFDLFDLAGHKVLSKQIANNRRIALKELSKGIYFYNFQLNGKTFAGKLIKQ